MVATSPHRLDGRGAVVVGVGAGIGRAIAVALAGAGAVVACLDVDRKAAEAVAAEAGQGAFGLACDVTDRASVEAAMQAAVARLPNLRALVYGAATRDPTASVVELSPDDWDRAVAVNLTGAFLVSRAGVPAMAKSGGGSLILIASQLARVGSPARPAYCATKGALLQLARVMAADHTKDNIRVNTLSPGAIATERLEERFGSVAEAERALGPKHLLGRLGRAEEIAAAALYLASDDSAFMTGSDLLIDGGYTAI